MESPLREMVTPGFKRVQSLVVKAATGTGTTIAGNAGTTVLFNIVASHLNTLSEPMYHSHTTRMDEELFAEYGNLQYGKRLGTLSRALMCPLSKVGKIKRQELRQRLRCVPPFR